MENKQVSKAQGTMETQEVMWEKSTSHNIRLDMQSLEITKESLRLV